MAQEVQRVRYFTGEFLQEADFNAEQAYHIRMRYLHNRWLHTVGIANGFEVSPGPGALQVIVSAGMALVQVTETRIPEFLNEDVAKEVVRISPTTLGLVGGANAEIYVVVSFAEQQAQPVATGNTRWLEQPDVRALAAGSPAPDNLTTLILARITLNAAGTGIQTIDTSGRLTAGVRGAVEATQLRLPVSGVANPAQWPTLRGGAANRLDLNGTLNVVAGGITLGAGSQVDGRDVSVDGANLDSHVASTAVHVTNGNAHTHSAGDGGPIPFSALTGVPDTLVKAFVVALGTSSPPPVLRAFGVAAVNPVARISVGNYTVNWAFNIPNPVVMISLLFPTPAAAFFYHITAINPASLSFVVTDTAGTLMDAPRFMISML